MWYLVVPPIVVVSSLFFLLWYLMRRGSDPAVVQKILENEKEEKLILPGVREFFLKRVEKFAQRFKVGLLRAHNQLNEFTQSVKKMRTRVAVSTEKKSEGAEDVFPDKVEEEHSVAESYDVLRGPLVRRGRGEVSERKEASFEEEKKVFIPRPIVSDAVTHPEVEKRVVRKEMLREETLIGRIARDPKDFTAYEELGDYYLETGSIKDAKECYRQVLRLSPVHRLVKIKIRRLEKLLTRGGE